MGVASTKHDRKILILGLNGSGKTTMLYHLKSGAHINVIPTHDFNMENIKLKGMHFSIWDIKDNNEGGTSTKNFINTKALVYVVDSSNRRGISDIKDHFKNLMENESLRRVPLVVALNKKDLLSSDPLSTDDIIGGLGLESLEQRWCVQPMNAVSGEGLYEAFDWICKLKEIKHH